MILRCMVGNLLGNKMSQFTKELEEFALCLGKDGYPTAIVERAAERMKALEEEVVRLTHELEEEIELSAELSNN